MPTCYRTLQVRLPRRLAALKATEVGRSNCSGLQVRVEPQSLAISL